MQQQQLKEEEKLLSSREAEQVLHRLIGEIEAIRLQRQREYRDRPHPQMKRFSQQELNDDVCPTYKNWLTGRSHQLPGRSTLLRIAEYLECNTSQRNDLLVCAQYLPEIDKREGSAFQQAVEQARTVLATLPYPAIVVTQTLHIHAANQLFLRLFELPDLPAIPPEQRSMAHLHFHPKFAIRERLTHTRQAQEAWQQHSLYGLQLFQRNNLLFRYDSWYQEILAQFSEEIADFRTLWEQAATVPHQEHSPIQTLLARASPQDNLHPIQFQQRLLSVSSSIFPAVSVLFPGDEAAQHLFSTFSYESF